MQSQISTISIFQFAGLANKFHALAGMQFSHKGLQDIPGLTFYKLAGTGAGEGLNWWPNFSVYALLCVWETRDHAERFFQENSIYVDYQTRAQYRFNVYLKCFKTHGEWSGTSPFEADSEIKTQNESVAILTRARIRTSRAADFWVHVPAVAKYVSRAPGRLFSVGFGEWPIFEQATFSIWKDYEAVRDFAYRQRLHADVVAKTRERKWYSEELFARFVVDDISGDWPGLRGMDSQLVHSKV